MNSIPSGKCRQSLLVVLVAGVALGIVAPGFAASAEGLDAGAKALAKLDDDWSKTAATKDAERVAAFYAEDALAYPPGEPLATGRAAAMKVWAAYFANPTFTISWKTDHAEVSKSGELGYTAGTYQASYKGPDGKPVKENGKYLCTWKLQADGTWKAVHDMWNTDSR